MSCFLVKAQGWGLAGDWLSRVGTQPGLCPRGLRPMAVGQLLGGRGTGGRAQRGQRWGGLRLVLCLASCPPPAPVPLAPSLAFRSPPATCLNDLAQVAGCSEKLPQGNKGPYHQPGPQVCARALLGVWGGRLPHLQL